MKYAEEEHARDLHRHLTRRFADSDPATDVSIDGAGVHWHCTAKRGHRFCTIACFSAYGPEFLTSFERDSETAATGRTSSKLDTINAVSDWLQGDQLVQLYDRFSFVDQTKRALASIRDEMLARVPELAKAAPAELQHSRCDIYELWFRGVDRSCEVSFYGKNVLPDAAFHWDECELFQFQAGDRARLAGVLKRWLCDQAMPSALRMEFPDIEIGELADYYEHGNPVEGEFTKSWDSIERFYDDVHFPFAPKVRNLIAQMRQLGYDKSLRAGTSLWTLIVSRSRRHGLRENQPMIAFSFRDDGMEVHSYLDKPTNEKFPDIELTPAIDSLLRGLEAKAVD